MTVELRVRRLERALVRGRRRLTALQARAERWAWVRLAAFVGGGGLTAVVVLSGGALAGQGLWVGAAALVVFVACVAVHRQLDAAVMRQAVWLQLKAGWLARAQLDWARIPPPRFAQQAPEHPFGSDLQITGERSLHQLLSTAVSHDGRARLRDWLCAPVPDPAGARRRQALVRALVPLTRLRERLTLSAQWSLDDLTLDRWSGADLQAWLTGPGTGRALGAYAAVLTLLSLTTVALFVQWLSAGWPGWWSVSLLVYVVLVLWRWQEAQGYLQGAGQWEATLRQLRSVFALLERYPYPAGSPVRALCAPFWEPARRPGRALSGVSGLIALASITRNPVLGPALNLLVPWDFWVAERVRVWQAGVAPRLAEWLDTWFELEALSALATFADLNPDYAFPDLLDAPGAGGLFAARGLGHPLLPRGGRVCNDFTLRAPGDLGLITGSNMSGKSSFLRTVGITLSLAYAGGPVVAEALALVWTRPFTALTVSDSLADGISYFYAEVRRLKALLDALDAAEPLPVFFLIDEIFRGTNNRERLEGSRAYVRALAARRGIGLISTHDLELARLAEDLAQITLYHFADQVEAGRMTFDYRLRPGASPTTNALALMRLAGLPT